ncbi:hypothetical protein XPN_1686, partial [Xanthomonas arboricola pv. pruni MAFF 301427]
EPVRHRRGAGAAGPVAGLARPGRRQLPARRAGHRADRRGCRRHRRARTRRRASPPLAAAGAGLARALAARRPARPDRRPGRRARATPARPGRWRAPPHQLPAAGRAVAGSRRPRTRPARPGRLAVAPHRQCRRQRRSPAAAAGVGRAPRADRHPAQEQGPGVSAGVPAVHRHRPQRQGRRPPLRGACAGARPPAALEDRQGRPNLERRRSGLEAGTTRRRRTPALRRPDPCRARAVDRQRPVPPARAHRTVRHAARAGRAAGRGRRGRSGGGHVHATGQPA